MSSKHLRLIWSLALAACGGPPPEVPPPQPDARATLPKAPTLAERLPGFAFAQLIETAPVPLTGGGSLDLSAATCGACHTEIHAEWQASTHAAAMADPQYLAELAKPDNPRWLCLSCHAPLQDQHPLRQQADTRLIGASARSVGALEPVAHPGYRPALRHEAITCATCHVRVDADGQGVIHGPRGDARAAPHRVRAAPADLRAVCARCHTPGRGELTPTFQCWFETHYELAAGPQAERDCVDCHMPQITRPVALGGPPRATRRHLWVGGGIPKRFEDYAGLLDRGWRPGLTVTVGRPVVEATGVTVAVQLTNDHGGHAVPTGDPERHLQISVRGQDAAGASLGRWRAQIGQRWDWGDAATGRPARKLSDDRILPGASRTLEARLPPLPPDGQVVVEVLHVRLSPANLRHAKAARLDAELAALRPDAQAVVAQLEAHLPSFSYVFAERWPLGGGPPITETPAALIARSRAMQGSSPAELEALLGP